MSITKTDIITKATSVLNDLADFEEEWTEAEVKEMIEETPYKIVWILADKLGDVI